ncbi:MAG: hypothetical protein ACRDP5_06740 [Streptosporangiaceae bacterium]
MSKITEYEPLTSPAADDLLLIVDVNDESMAATGTDKKITVGDLLLQPLVAALTDGADILIDARDGNVFTVTLGGDRTLANPHQPGSRTVTWDAAYDWGSGNSAPALSTTAYLTDILGFEYVATTVDGSPLDKWVYLSAPFPQGF